MKRRTYLSGVALVACVFALGACAHSEASASGGSPPTHGTKGSVLRELGSASFVSVSGTDAAQEVSWLATDPLTVRLTHQSRTTLIVDTPCNTLDVPVTATGTTLDPDVAHLVATAMGCIGAASEQEAWATTFVKHKMSYALVGTKLTLTTPGETMVLQRSGS